MPKYNNYTDDEKVKILYEQYVVQQKSFGSIALEYDTYANKLRRDAKKFNIKIRTKSESQKIALEKGIHKHPTKGTQRSSEIKEKIGRSVMNAWDSMNEADRDRRSEISKKNWDKLTDNEKKERFLKANEAIRKSSKHGSKLETFLLNALLENGYKVEPHKQNILNTNLHVDLFLPGLNIAIEVDGPSHHEPVWGDEALQRAKRYDDKKNGLLLGKGLKLIRVKQRMDFSKSRARKTSTKLIATIEKIKSGKDNYIEIGDE